MIFDKASQGFLSLNRFNESSLTGTGFHAPLSFGPGSSGGHCIGGKACPVGFATDADGVLGGAGGVVETLFGSYSGGFEEGGASLHRYNWWPIVRR